MIRKTENELICLSGKGNNNTSNKYGFMFINSHLLLPQNYQLIKPTIVNIRDVTVLQEQQFIKKLDNLRADDLKII